MRRNHEPSIRVVFTAFIVAIVSLALACSTEPARIDRVEIMDFGRSVAIGDGGRRAATLEQVGIMVSRFAAPVRKTGRVPPPPAPGLRFSFGEGPVFLEKKVAEMAVLVGPLDAPRPGIAVLKFRFTEKPDWYEAVLRQEEFIVPLAAVDAVNGTQLVLINGMTPSQFDACRRSLHRVAAVTADPVETLSVESVSDVTWPNAALGFPRPGRAYAEAVVPGHTVIVKRPGGKTVECHTSATNVLSALD